MRKTNGNPNVFNVKRNDGGERWLNANYANPSNRWNLENEIESIRKPKE